MFSSSIFSQETDEEGCEHKTGKLTEHGQKTLQNYVFHRGTYIQTTKNSKGL